MKIEKTILTKESAKKIMQETKGEVRGICLKTDIGYLMKNRGKEGLGILEKEWEKLGYDLEYEKIKTGGFYPLGMEIINTLLIWKLFDFDVDKMREMGYEAVKISLFFKLLFKYFSSLEQTLKETSKVWRHHYTVGEIKIEVDEEKKQIIAKLYNFSLHPIYCLVLEGFLESVTQLMIQRGKMTCRETKCTFKGDKFHEFIARW